ncbi:MAG: GlsB/YeaQ/YmgE family stress response membrane protein [Oscillospiraceae bacterium]|nr:GlsB/YeaQ/YmgE family stress response membrane protein [Oscillospiraceae bacterium]
MLISILLWLLFGALIGWIAGMIMKSKRSLLGNIIFGIIGSIIGGFVAALLGFGSIRGGFSFDIWNIVISVAGACLLIFIVGILKGKK